MSQDPAQIRAAGYARNMDAMREYLSSHPCRDCGKQYPLCVMRFANPPPGEWSISRIAGSRCQLSALEEAMRKTDVLCANCREIREWKGK